MNKAGVRRAGISRLSVRSLVGTLFLLLGVWALFAAPSASAAETPPAKNVLILYSFSERTAFAPPETLESKVRSRIAVPVNFYVEYLEAQRLIDPKYEKTQVQMLHDIYGTSKLDLVIVAAFPALRLVLAHRDQLFPGIPIVFCYLDPGRIAGKSWPGVTGVTANVEPAKTIDLALRFHPNTTTIAVVTNTSEFESYWLAAVHRELLHYRNQVRVIDFVGLPSQDLIEKVTTLPSTTVVLFQIAPQQSVQSAVGPYDVVAAIGKRLPTYCIFPMLCLNHGGVGGASGTDDDQAELIAKEASLVLSGERPENIPVAHGDKSMVRVDWRQLRRWHIPESALPPGSVVLYREPTFWERDRKYIIPGLVVIVAQSILIAGLLWQRARKRKAEAGLRESEKRFRVMADTTPSLIWMCDEGGRITYLNNRRVEFTGTSPNAGYGDTWISYVHKDDLKNVLSLFSEAFKSPQPFSSEYRLRRYDGTYRWMFDVASPRVNGDGTFAGFIGSAIDVSDQKIAQEALEKVSGRLIEAQEKERTRIARDLHDDICQRLALLSMELEQANRNGSPPATNRRLEEIRQHCSEIAVDVQSLSHQLHSSKLDYLGIVAATRGFCREFARQHKVDIVFTDDNVPTRLPKDVSLCLFRVAQEGLHNAVKYSGTDQCTVELTGTHDEVQLVIRDAGSGFDVEEAKRTSGLGLVSMQERVHLVHGRFYIESRPGAGTRIVASVPLITTNGESTGVTKGDSMARAEGAA